MDIFFSESGDPPVSPSEVRFKHLVGQPWPDGRRVQVNIELTPFLKKPNLELRIANSAGEVVASLEVVEAIDFKMDFTMHLRESQPNGKYHINARIFYTDLDRYTEEEPEQEATVSELLQEASNVVDTLESEFIISGKQGSEN